MRTPPAAKCLVAGRGPPRRRPRRPRQPPSSARCQPARPPGRGPMGPPGPPPHGPPLPLLSSSSGASRPAVAGATPAPPCAAFGARSRPAARPQWHIRPARPAYYSATPAFTTHVPHCRNNTTRRDLATRKCHKFSFHSFLLNSITLTLSKNVIRLSSIAFRRWAPWRRPGAGRPGRPAAQPAPAKSAQQSRIGS